MHFLSLKRKVDTTQSSMCPNRDYCSSAKKSLKIISIKNQLEHTCERMPSEQLINTLVALAYIFVEYIRLFGL